jgi:hypothetical protein
MKECPYCAHENEDAAIVCMICHAEIDPPSAPEADPLLQNPALSLRIVATFRNVVEAGLFKARLEAAGIEACIPEEYTPQVFWNVIPNPLERVPVQVAAKDYGAARFQKAPVCVRSAAGPNEGWRMWRKLIFTLYAGWFS